MVHQCWWWLWWCWLVSTWNGCPFDTLVRSHRPDQHTNSGLIQWTNFPCSFIVGQSTFYNHWTYLEMHWPLKFVCNCRWAISLQTTLFHGRTAELLGTTYWMEEELWEQTCGWGRLPQPLGMSERHPARLVERSMMVGDSFCLVRMVTGIVILVMIRVIYWCLAMLRRLIIGDNNKR